MKPIQISALSNALSISLKAVEVGFEWPDIEGVWAKFFEEIDELKNAINNESKLRQEAELGDILFTLVNIGRFLNIDSEKSLAKANQRFVKRFEQMRKIALGDGISLEECSLHQLEGYWNQSKTMERMTPTLESSNNENAY